MVCPALNPPTIDLSGLVTAAERRPAVALADRSNRVMWISDERVFYAGLAGTMSARTMGGWHLYVALGDPIRIALQGGDWACTELAVVPPYVAHRVASDERLVADVVIEPETVDEAALPAFVRTGRGPVQGAQPFVAKVRHLHAWLCTQGRERSMVTAQLDEALFGAPLAPRRIDARIAEVLQRIRSHPAQPASAEALAASVALSTSRFLHLFSAEAGVSLRQLRSWKRARSLLHHVTRDANLSDVALDTGYPDSTHFSHAIRQFYGLKPRDIFAGSRKLAVLGE